MSYEVHLRGTHVNGRETTMFVAVSRGGDRLVFSKPCLEFLTEDYVLCFSDKENEMAAVKPCNDTDLNGYPVKKMESQAYVSAKAFIGKIGLSRQGRVPVEFKDGMLQFSTHKKAED